MADRNLFTRRELLKRTALATAETLAVPMINRGRYKDIELILGGNFKRVLAQTWTV